MPTRVSVQGPDGQSQIYVYDRSDQALGGGNTGIVYAAYLEADPTQPRVAIKVVRPGQEHDLYREMDIIDRLRRQNRPASERVPWALIGREQGTLVPAPCLVMEKVDALLSAQLAQLGATPLTDAASTAQPILQKERLAARSGQQYAQLLLGMKLTGIISSGDRKPSDFRWLPDGRGDGRLVVLDWNRAQWIDTNLDPTRFEQPYIDRRRAELDKGSQGDIAIFAHSWAHFLLNRAIGDTLPEMDDPEPAWQALTLGMRDILRRALMAGRAGGFGSADELLRALAEQVKRLDLPLGELLRQMGEVQRQGAPGWEADLERLIDIAARKGASEDDLRSWRSVAGRRSREAMDNARAAERSISMNAKVRQWDKVVNQTADALDALGPASPETGPAHLLLQRWRVAATVGIAVQESRSQTDVKEWTTLVTDALQALGQSLDDRFAPADALAKLRSAEKTAPSLASGLEPLRLEAELRQKFNESAPPVVIADTWQRVEGSDGAYALVLRLAWPALDRQLTAGDLTQERRETDALRLANLKGARDNLFAQFQRDVDNTRLPPGDRATAEAVAAEWGPLWAAFYAQAAPFRTADGPTADWLAQATTLDALVDALLRQRPDETARMMQLLLREELFDTATRHRLLTTLLEQLEATLNSDEPLWPDQLRRAQAAAGTLSIMATAATRDRLTALETLIAPRLAQLTELQTSLRVGDYLPRNDWPGLVEHLAAAGGAADDGTDAIDDALRAAIAARLEVWEPAADALAGDTTAHEAYRARTLLALRAARQLPQRLRDFSQALLTQADALERESAGLDGLQRHFAESGEYAARLAALDRQLQQQRDRLAALAGQAETAKQRADATAQSIDLATDQLSKRLTQMELTLTNIESKALTFDDALTAQPRLAALWLAHAIDQAARLKLDQARSELQAARELLGNGGGAVQATANNVDRALTQLEKWRQSRDTVAWEWLEKLSDVLSQPRGSRRDAYQALAEFKMVAPAWGDNLVVRHMAHQIDSLPKEQAVAPPSPPPADSQPRDPQPPADSRLDAHPAAAEPPAPSYSPAKSFFPSTGGYQSDPGPLGGAPVQPPPAPDYQKALESVILMWRNIAWYDAREREGLRLMEQANRETDLLLRGNPLTFQELQNLYGLIQKALEGMEFGANRYAASRLVNGIAQKLGRK